MKYIAIAVAVLGLAVPSPVNAAEWWWTGGAITKPNRAAIFVDRTSVQQVGGYTRAWVKMVPENPAIANEILALNEVDCAQRRYRLLSQLTRFSDGRTDNRNSQPGWEFSTPESAIDGTISAICGNQNSWIAHVQNTSAAARFIFAELDKR